MSKKDVREICCYCKNQDTKQVIDKLELAPYAEYYGVNKFKVFWCFFCNATWHFKADFKY